MDFHARRDRALQLLAQAGVKRSSYAPFSLRLLWRCGVRVRPPHFMGFGAAALLSGAWFGLGWGGFMWLVFWSHQRIDPRLALAATCFVGCFFGLWMAASYARERRKYDLPRWEALD